MLAAPSAVAIHGASQAGRGAGRAAVYPQPPAPLHPLPHTAHAGPGREGPE